MINRVLLSLLFCSLIIVSCNNKPKKDIVDPVAKRIYNDTYRENNLNRIAFPLGGIGAGMICLEGTGAFSH
ncbi:MAG TPA: hypothetical protein VGK38_14675, partial [Prolixibacteraceae bacterium]